MSTCPNRTSPEWIALEAAVGSLEANRDYLATGGEIRTPEEVLAKLADATEPTFEDEIARPKMPIQLEIEYGPNADGSLIAQSLAQDAHEEVENTENPEETLFSNHDQAVALAQSMSTMLRIDYQTVTAEEARALTEKIKNPWKAGDKAFFLGGRVYFVGDHLSLETVFHEFSHPFVRHIAATNPKLFNNLYNQVKQTEEGTKIIAEVKELYGGDARSNLFKEEVIVKALTSAGVAKMEDVKTDSAFTKVIKNIMYAIKQLMRKVFGDKSAVGGLTAATTMSELTDMLLKGERIVIDKSLVSQSDFAAYEKDRKEFVKEFVNAGSEHVQKTIDDFHTRLSNHIRILRTNKNYTELAEILKNPEKQSDLVEIKGNIQGFQSEVMKRATEATDDLDHVQKQATALVNSMFRLEQVMEKIRLHTEDIMKEGESRENLHQAYYYSNLIEDWQEFINDAKRGMDVYEMPHGEVQDLVGRMERSIGQTRKYINEMQAVGARDGLYAELAPAYSSIKARYDKMIDNLREKPQSAHRDNKIDKLYKQYHGVTQAEHERLRELQTADKKGHLPKEEATELKKLTDLAQLGIAITPEKIEAILKGGIGDAHFYNSYLEGYLYNTDPVIGGLASYVKNKLNAVIATAQGKTNMFANDMEPLLLAAGFNPLIINEFGERVSFVDTMAKVEKDGTVIKREVRTFLNPFKDYRYAYDVHKMAVRAATEEFARTGTDEAKTEMHRVKSEEEIFLRENFNQQYVAEFYEKDKLFEKDDIGRAALAMRRDWNIEYRTLTNLAESPTEKMEIAGQIDMMWRKWRQLSSLTDLDGNVKTGVYELPDGTRISEVDIAKRIKEYSALSRKFYESEEIPGVFQTALESYMQEIVDNNIAEVDDDTYNSMRAIWIDKNTKKIPTQEWYDYRQRLLNEQAVIYKKLKPDDRRALDESVIMTEILDLTGGFKDDYSQTIAPEMSEGSRIRLVELEEELIALRKEGIKLNGLNPEQDARFTELNDLRKTKQWTPELSKELSALFEITDELGLSKYDRRDLRRISAELTGMSKREATDYYIDIMNNWLGKLEVKNEAFKVIDKLSADELLDIIPYGILGQNADFDKWFYANHVIKERFNKELGEKGEMEEYWARSMMWSSTVPTDQSHFETYDLLDNLGNTVETIEGKPINKYFKSVVKPEYRTEKIVGETVDNQMQWLPKTEAQGAVSREFINDEYFELEKNEPATFKAMQKMKEWHLRNQEDVSWNSRLYLDFPRLRKSNLELVQSDHFLTNIAKRTKEFFYTAKDDAEDDFNWNDQSLLVRMDMFDNESSKIPISGLYDIDVKDVSTDITTTMMKYMLSAERQKQMIEILPMASAVQAVVNKSDDKDFKDITASNFLANNINPFGKSEGMAVRKKAVTNFIDREFFGQQKVGAGSESAWINNTATLLFKRASQTFFAFNIASALKNSYGAKFQAMIHASAGEDMTHYTLQQGNAWAYGVMGEMSFGGQLYQKGARSLKQQIIQSFDPSQGRTEQELGEGLSRTILKDLASFSWTTNFRKWVELQATFQIFGGMMYHKMIPQTQADNTVKEIPYMDAWQTINGLIQLKPGIDPKWGITYNAEGEIQVGDEYSRFKTRVHVVMNNLQGAYAKFDQPEAQRYIAFRFLSYLRRYFTTMVMNRFGFSGRFFDPQPRVNPGLGDIHTGYYVTFLNLLKNTITSLGQDLMYMTAEEKRAAIKFISEVGMLLAINAVMSLVLGWDPDDEDRFEKLRDKSGSLPFPFVPNDPKRPFNGWGFLENHMLYLLMNVRAENEQFLPLPKIGLDDYTAMLDLKSIAFGPTVQTYQQLIDDAIDIMAGNDRANYSKDVGPYSWQKEGSPKIWAHLAAMFTMKGSNVDAAQGIKNFQSVQAMQKR